MGLFSNYNDSMWIGKIAARYLSKKDFDKIDKSAVHLSFKKGETLLKQEGASTHIVYLEKGAVKFNYESKNNKNLILNIIAAPKLLGGANLFYKDNNLFSIVAIEDCEAVFINANVLLGVMEENSKFTIVLFQYASEMFKSTLLNFISLAHKQKEGRIADILIYLMKEVYGSSKFNLTLTRKEIAEFASCSTENVIMTLSKWQNEKIIVMDNKQIEVIDLDKLMHISKFS